MGWAEDFLREQSRKTGATVEQSDIEELYRKNPEDVEAHKRALEEQYELRGAPTSHRGVDSQSLDQSVPRDPRTEQGYQQSVGQSWSKPAYPTRPSTGGGYMTGLWDPTGQYQPGMSTPEPFPGGQPPGGQAQLPPGTLTPGPPDWYQQMFNQLQAQLASEKLQRETEAAARQQQEAARAAAAAQQEAARIAQRDQLYGQLQGRAQQSLNVQATDPTIAAQTSAYAAQQERARQNYLADLAERSGPLTNLQGEQRLTAERQGAQTAGFQADLMARELTARRDEIAGSLQQMGGLLSGEQQANLQRELGLLNNAIQQRQADATLRGQDAAQRTALLQGALGAAGQAQDWQQGLMQNQLQWQIEQLRQEQARRQLSLEAEDRASYWDYMRSRR